MKQRIDTGLRSAAALKPGRGSLDLGLFATQRLGGLSLSYKHRWSETWYAFADAQAGYDWKSKQGELAAFAGIGARF